jgi:hypothetical protein
VEGAAMDKSMDEIVRISPDAFERKFMAWVRAFDG